MNTFDSLPPSARVWVYQASRPLTEAELTAVAPALLQFVTSWASHGQALQAGATFVHRQFLVIGLDERAAGASGCSIDASVRFVQALEQQLKLNLLDKSRLAFLLDGTVQLFERGALRAVAAAGQLAADSLYFDNTVLTKEQLQTAWPVEAGRTWLRKYFVMTDKTVAA